MFSQLEPVEQTLQRFDLVASAPVDGNALGEVRSPLDRFGAERPEAPFASCRQVSNEISRIDEDALRVSALQPQDLCFAESGGKPLGVRQVFRGSCVQVLPRL